MLETAILGFARTPIGSINGALREVHPDKLGSAALVGAFERSSVPAETLGRVLVGTLLDAGRGPNPARALVMEAGFEAGPSSLVIRAGGGSGLEALVIAASELSGDAVSVAVGVDSSTLTPYLLPEARHGSRLGHGRVLDGAAKDAWDSWAEELPLPALAAIALQQLGIDRKGFLDGRLISVERAREAAGKGEVVPIGLPLPGGAEKEHFQDDLPGADTPARGDEVYAAPLADGAAAVILATPARAAALGRAHAPRVVACVRTTIESRRAPRAPAEALKALLAASDKKPGDLAVVEIDESLYVAPEIVRRELGIAPDRLNPRGGAHAYGHPAGACGLRALVAALAELERRGGGLAAVSYGTGGGGAIALLVSKG